MTGPGAGHGSCPHTGHRPTDEAVRPPALPRSSDHQIAGRLTVSPPSLWSCYAVPGSGHRRTPRATNLTRLAVARGVSGAVRGAGLTVTLDRRCSISADGSENPRRDPVMGAQGC